MSFKKNELVCFNDTIARITSKFPNGNYEVEYYHQVDIKEGDRRNAWIRVVAKPDELTK